MPSSLDAAKVAIFPLPVQNAKLARGAQRSATLSDGRDEELIGKLRSGNQEALGILFRRYSGLARGIGNRILRDDAEAEDLVQDVFLYVFRNSTAFDSKKGSARSWIVQNIYYRAFHRRRYLSSRHQLFGMRQAAIDSETTQLGSRNSASAVFDGTLVQEILEGLTPDQCETMRLFFFEGYTLAEISAKVGQPLGNVRHHYYRGLSKLRARLFVK